VRAYQDSHSPASIQGKTADEIVARYGAPFHLVRGDDGHPEVIMYKDVAHAQYCAIELHDGVAVRVTFSFQ